MSDKDQPAFPMPAHTDQNGTRVPMAGGMTLRDYFAAKAMQGWAADSGVTTAIGAKWAYEMADAMLAAREAK